MRTPSTLESVESSVNPPDLPPPHVGAETVPGLIRKVRRLADLSQRELARAARVSPSTVARIESGALAPSLDTLLRLLAVAKLVLVVTDEQGQVVQPMRLWDDTRDGAERHYPAHLDLILDPRNQEWWACIYGLARPPETFHRDRRWRDARRRRSQWEVRVKQLRHVPPPPDPDHDPNWRQKRWRWPED
jgi:transcriptional regulator with XRE-family HTH domain